MSTIHREPAEARANARLTNTMAKLLMHAGFEVEIDRNGCVTALDPVHRSFGGQLVVDHYNKIRIVDLDQLLRFLDARG